MPSETQRVLLIKYGEIHLKGLNRPMFKRLLKTRLAEAFAGFHCDIFEEGGRVYVSGYDPLDEGQVIERAHRVFGVVAVCPAACVDKRLDAIADAAARELQRAISSTPQNASTFKVRARRSDKTFPLLLR